MSEACQTRPVSDGPPRAPHPDEIPALHSWLDRGLRRGVSGRLASEYPLTMGPDGSRRHRVVYEEGRPVAHAMSHLVRIVADGRALDVGMIGNVYTDPSRRGLGLAGRCLEASVEDSRRSGAALALLWSDSRELYARSGFHPAGIERIWLLGDPGRPVAHDASAVRPAVPEDMARLEQLYDAKRIRVQRARGDLAKLAAAPGTRLVVAVRDARIVAYAAAGRGDDFHGIVHEWAGDPPAVAHCAATLRTEGAAVAVLGGPLDSALGTALAAGGARLTEGVFAQARILDAQAIWQSLAGACGRLRFQQDGAAIALRTERGSWLLPNELANRLFFGTCDIDLSALPRPAARLLVDLLPWPLYLWGFDSI